jgi:hypothetical protein
MESRLSGRCVHEQSAGFRLKFTVAALAFFFTTRLLFAPAPPQPPIFTSVVVTNNVYTITFTVGGGQGTNWQLISSSNVSPISAYTVVPGATNVQIASNTYQVVVTNFAPTQYFALVR